MSQEDKLSKELLKLVTNVKKIIKGSENTLLEHSIELEIEEAISGVYLINKDLEETLEKVEAYQGL